jgi:hypothetical protein
MCHVATDPKRIIMTNKVVRKARIPSITAKRRRLSELSMRRPATGLTRTDGSTDIPIVRAVNRGEFVRLKVSQPSTTLCIHSAAMTDADVAQKS